MPLSPIFLWSLFFSIIVVLLALDLGVFHKNDEAVSLRKSLFLSGFYIGVALLFGLWVAYQQGYHPFMDYLTSYAIEKSLSLDNIFVMSLIFGALKIPSRYQHRVLVWGIVSVIILRGLFIGAGIEMIHRFSWMLYLFGIFLILTGVKIFLTSEQDVDPKESKLYHMLQKVFPITRELHGHHFYIKNEGKWQATPLFIALIMIECADIIFAVDSVPAVLAITTDPYIVCTSNIFAILGLRALYMALAVLIDRFSHLKYALPLILIFVGGKIFMGKLGFHIPSFMALMLILTILAGGITYSFAKTRRNGAS